jgi:DMSO/TMAO reductase YedYZ molybdopterin-dependent catalytic subunit
MEPHEMSRRSLLKGGGATLAGLSVLNVTGPAHAFPGRPGEDVVIPWLDTRAPVPGGVNLPNQLDWEELDSWYTPADDFFVVSHYPQPPVDAQAWRVAIDGHVARPRSLSLADLRARPRREVDFTMECSGNTGLPFFTGGIGNARWAGTPLAPLLHQAGVGKEGTEVVFWGADRGTVTIRDNGGVPSPPGVPPALEITEQFARSMSLDDALSPDNLLCYEMNGVPLPPEHGFPVRLIAPGWYGVANVKWLNRIELRDGRYAGRFMARDYVTIREEGEGALSHWTFTTVGHDRLKSAPAKVTRRRGRYAVMGAAWGAPIAAVEVRIDDGPWLPARLVGDRPRRWRSHDFAWTFWTFGWDRPAAGEHRVTSRAYDVDGNVQPPPEDPYLARKVTYWESNGQITRRVRIPG